MLKIFSKVAMQGRMLRYGKCEVQVQDFHHGSALGLQDTSSGSLMFCSFTYCTGKEKCLQTVFFFTIL